MNLLSETEYTDAATPPIQHDYVWFAGAPVAQVTHSVPSEPLAAPEVVWTVTDHLGTPRIQTDSTGAIVWHAEHEPYGRIYVLREGEGRHQPLRFPGQEAEQLGVNAANGITDRNYNIFRWYRASEGRYTQSDPLGLERELNLFSYAAGNPILEVDSVGLNPVPYKDQKWRPCKPHEYTKCWQQCAFGVESCMVAQIWTVTGLVDMGQGPQPHYGWKDAGLSCNCKEPDCYDKVFEWVDEKKKWFKDWTPKLPPFIPVQPIKPKPVVPGLPPILNPCLFIDCGQGDVI